MSYISKSKLKFLMKCDLQFLLELTKPELKKYNSQSLFSFNIGNNFEKKVKDIFFPNGILISKRKNIEALEETKKLLGKNNTLFESAFESNNIIVKTDVFIQNNEQISIIEIKSGTRLKEDYLHDALIQYWTIKNSGIKIYSFEIWLADKDSANKVNKQSVIDYCEKNKEVYFSLINKAKEIQNHKKSLPKYGNHCQDCPFNHYCFKNIKDNKLSPYNLPNFHQKWEALNNSIHSIKDEVFKKKYNEYWENNQLQLSSILENKFKVNKLKLTELVSKIEQPFHCLDFEAVSYSEPVFKKIKPYEPSLIFISHINQHKHNYFMIDNIKQFNKTKMAQKLVDFCEYHGSIIVWDKSLEIKLISDLIKSCSDETLILQLHGLKDRIVDLKEIFESSIYHPDFLGSFSLKNISNVILKKDFYENSNIKNGFQINNEYLKIINKEKGSDKIKQDLIQYGKNDVLSLEKLTQWLLIAIKK